MSDSDLMSSSGSPLWKFLSSDGSSIVMTQSYYMVDAFPVPPRGRSKSLPNSGPPRSSVLPWGSFFDRSRRQRFQGPSPLARHFLTNPDILIWEVIAGMINSLTYFNMSFNFVGFTPVRDSSMVIPS